MPVMIFIIVVLQTCNGLDLENKFQTNKKIQHYAWKFF